MIKRVKQLISSQGQSKLKLIWECGHARDKEAVLPLIDILLNDTDIKFRSEAALVLGHIGDKRAVEPLLTALKEGASKSKIREATAKTLDILEKFRRGESEFGALFTIPEYPKLAEIRTAAACALGELGDDRAVDPLLEALGDWSWSVQCAAAVALGLIGDRRAAKPLKHLLANSTDEYVRDAALKGLEHLSGC